MSISSFQVKYRRPKILSDPYSDFTPEHLTEILVTPDDQLEGRHYAHLFGPHLPAGTYRESIYFLPRAFQYLLAHEREAVELITPIVGFVSKNKQQLAKDKIWSIAQDCIRECLDYWTSKFEVIHYDEKACKEKGWSREHFDYVRNSDSVVHTTADLVRFETIADLAEEFVQRLGDDLANPLKAAWFLEYSRSQYGPGYYPPEYRSILELINDQDLLLKAAVLVEEQVMPDEPSPTYWHDTFEILGLV